MRRGLFFFEEAFHSCSCQQVREEGWAVNWKPFLSLRIYTRSQWLKRKRWWQHHWVVVRTFFCVFSWLFTQTHRVKGSFFSRPFELIICNEPTASAALFCALRSCLVFSATALPATTRFGFFAGSWLVFLKSPVHSPQAAVLQFACFLNVPLYLVNKKYLIEKLLANADQLFSSLLNNLDFINTIKWIPICITRRVVLRRTKIDMFCYDQHRVGYHEQSPTSQRKVSCHTR